MNNKYTFKILYLLGCALATLVVLYPSYPPMVDLPQHAAQVNAFKLIIAGEYVFKDSFDVNWFTPYWLGYSLIYLFSSLLGVVVATKITVAIAVFLFPISATYFTLKFKGEAHWCWIYIILPFGFAFEWGLLNFILGASFGFLFLANIRVGVEKYSLSESLKLAILVHLLFLAHVLILAVFILIATMMLYNKNIIVWIKRCLPFCSVLPVFVIWFYITITSNTQAAGSGPWEMGWHRVSQFLPGLFSLPKTFTFQFAALFFCCLPFFLGWRFSSNPQRFLPFLIYSAIMLLGPNYLFGNFYTYNRFGFIGLPFYFFMFENCGKQSVFELGKFASKSIRGAFAFFALIMVAYNIQKSFGYDREARDFQAVLNEMESEKRVLSLIFTRNSAFYEAPTYLHYPVWYQAEKNGLVDFNFALFYPQIVRYREDSKPVANDAFVWYPQFFNWKTFKGQNYDYFLFKAPTSFLNDFSPISELELIAESGEWKLYKSKEGS